MRGRRRTASSPPIDLDMRRRPFIGLDGAGEFVLDARAEHLDRDVAALGGDGVMDLGDGGGADRLRVDRRRRTARPAPPRPASIAALIAGKGAGGRSSWSWSRFARRRLADQVGAGGERLAELDRGRADLLQGRGIIGPRWACAAPKRATRHSRRTSGGVSGSRSMPCKRAVPRQRPAPFEEAPEMDDGGGGQIFHPLQMQTRPPSIGSTLALAKPASAIIRRKASGLGKRRIDSTR